MTPTTRKWSSLIVFVLGTGILGTVWWMNGAQKDELWLYIFCVWLVIYAAYEVFVSGRKR